ncbi:mercuric transporter MerT family protein [uncultured Vibrio sp.]|uniref:mercuric transporter MerT family protein n=1 Tax=uncultured Vibrio sp. TaxID=114054 RepID=UPI0025CC6F41|nr:mercuric transporter MerT family protein [uncultured Vibrio sp.]
MNKNPSIPLIGGMIAAIGASLCCAGPLILLLLGVSGSWISSLTMLEPYRPIFIVSVIIAFVLAASRIYRPIDECKEGSLCAIPKTRRRQKMILWVTSTVALILVVSPYWIPVFV